MDVLTAGNPVAHRVRVYYTGSDTLKEGEPLCYSFKTTRSWWGGSVSDAGVVSASEYVAEGSHNPSKYICVESPMRASITDMDSAAGSNVITGDGTDFANLQVGMAVSIASDSGVVSDGNYVITAVGALGITITLDMTTAEAAAVTAQTDVTVQIDNISSFAGVVAKGGWVGKAGPRVIDIYVPNKAVVPVRTDQPCILGRTILSIHSNEQHLTGAYEVGGMPVAIAWETDSSLDGSAGLVLAKLDPDIFLHQKGDGDWLLVDDVDSANFMPNQIRLETIQTTGLFSALQIKGKQSAGNAGSWDYGLALNVEAEWSGGTMTGGGNGTGCWINLGAVTISGATLVSALRAGIYEAGTCVFTSCYSLAPLSLAVQVATDPGTGFSMIYCRNDGAQSLDAFIHGQTAGAIAQEATAIGQDKNSTKSIKILVGATPFYIPTYSAGDIT